MKFNSEIQRMEHPQARLVPIPIWEVLFKDEITDVELMLLQADIVQDQDRIVEALQDMSSVSIYSGDQKLRAGVCILLGDPECSDTLIKNSESLTLLPDDLLSIAVITNRNDMIATIIAQYPNTKSWLGTAFIKACRVGNIDALIQLAAYSPENVFAMIEYKDYLAFVDAAKNNQLLTMAWLMQQLSPRELQDMLKAIGSVAFSAAAESGYLPVMEWLLNQLTDPAERSKMIKGSNYEAFNNAVEKGHLDIMDWITGQSSPNEKHAMLTQEQSLAVYNAAGNGYLPVISRIFEQLNASEQQELIKAAGFYHLFESAANGGHRDVLNWLMTKLILNSQEKEDFKNKLRGMFENGAEGGHLQVMRWVLEQVDDAEERQELLGTTYSFIRAAMNGHLDVLEWYLEQTYIGKLKKIKDDGFSTAFSMAANNGHLPIMKWLFNHLDESGKQKAIINAFYESSTNGHLLVMQWLVEQLNQLNDKNDKSNLFAQSFKFAARQHHLPAMQWLMKQVDSHTQVVMIKKDNYWVFQHAAKHGQLSVLKWLMGTLSDPNEQLAMIRADQYRAFSEAGHGQLPAMQWLMKQLSDPIEQQAMLKAYNYQMAGEYPAIIEWLMKQLPDNGQAMIKYNDYDNFKGAVREGSLPVIKLLLNHSDEQAQRRMVIDAYKAAAARTNNKAETDYLLSFPSLIADLRENIQIYDEHVAEYGKRYVSLFVNKELHFLRAQKFGVEADNAHVVFNVDANQARTCFYMLRNLIRQNSEDLQDDILFLLDIPAIKELIVTEVTRGRPNELLRLALSTDNRNAANILLGIPEIRELAAENNFYRNEMRGQLDLRELARDTESSMHALSKAEQKRLDKVLERYQPMMMEQGVESLFRNLQEELAARYSKNPARVATGDGRIIELPLTWSDWKELAKTLSADTCERALQAYYQNKDHCALRYLSKPNSWMFVDLGGFYAEYVSHNSNGAWSTFDQYKPEITMFWLAASDQDIQPIDGFTFETRMDHFVDELAHLGRAHNWDQLPRIKMNDVGDPILDKDNNFITEEYDDLKGDKPSCYSGVKRRLFQSVLGHPLLKILTMEAIKQELREFVREYFKQVITDKNRDEIRDAWDKLCMANPLSYTQKDSLAKLNIPQENQINFIKYLTKKYPGQFDEGVDAPEFRRYVEESFKPTKVFEWHAVRFATETDLDKILAQRLSPESIRNAKSRLSHCGNAGTVIMNEINCLQRGSKSTWSSIWAGSEEKLTCIIAALNSLPNEKYEEQFISMLLDQESALFQALFKPLSADAEPADAKFLKEIKECINQFGCQARL